MIMVCAFVCNWFANVYIYVIRVYLCKFSQGILSGKLVV